MLSQFISISDLQDQGLKATRCVILIINLFAWVVLTATTSGFLKASKW